MKNDQQMVRLVDDHKWNRREFLRSGIVATGIAEGAFASPEGSFGSSGGDSSKKCILLFLVGGCSHLDTWDLKPMASTQIRGPFRPIRTKTPGIHISEHFPRMAQLSNLFTLVRSVYHDRSPIHETGQQLLQTGLLSRDGIPAPHIGSILAYSERSRRSPVPPFVLLPGPITNTGVSVDHGQSAGFLGTDFDPFIPGTTESRYWDRYDMSQIGAVLELREESVKWRTVYGATDFGANCLRARRFIERGARMVAVNMFDTVFGQTTWDCHADGASLATTLADYRNELCPAFDQAFSGLISDLHDRGLLEETMVIALTEFGRTPYLNPRGGRDHWPGVWTIISAGGGSSGGRIIGSSDRDGAYPLDHPIKAEQIPASILSALGVQDIGSQILPNGRRLCPNQEPAIHGLFA